MNRYNLIKELRTKKRILGYRLLNKDKYKSNSHLLKDANKFLKLEKEIEIQQSFLDYER